MTEPGKNHPTTSTLPRDDTETDSELSEGPLTRTGSAHSSRRALYTAELFSNSLTPAHRCRVKVIHNHHFSPPRVPWPPNSPC